MKEIKTVLIIVFISFFMFVTSDVVQAENYILLSTELIENVENCNPDIISIKPLATLMNDKKNIIVSPLKDGVAQFKIVLKRRTLCYKAVVKDDKIEFKGNMAIKIVPLDLPPEILPQGDVCQ